MLKLIVLLIGVIVSAILCFITSLFIKKQNFYIDLQLQFKKKGNPQPPSRPGDRYERDEECGDHVESPGGCSSDEDESCDEDRNKRPESKRIHSHPLSRLPSYCMETESSSNASEPEFLLPACNGPSHRNNAYKSVNEKCHRNARKCNSDREQRPRPKSACAAAQKPRSQSAGCHEKPKRAQKPPKSSSRCKVKGSNAKITIKAKCVSIPQQRSISSCNSCFYPGKEKFKDKMNLGYEPKQAQKKKVDCLVFMDPPQANEKGKYDRPKFSVLPVKPYNSQNVNNENICRENSRNVQKSRDRPHYQNTYNAQAIEMDRRTPHIYKPDSTEQSTSQIQEPSQEHSSRSAKSGHGSKSIHDNVVQEISSYEVLMQRLKEEDCQDDEKMLQKKIRKSQPSTDQSMNLTTATARSKHNLEKLREKRKERKRTLLKLQYESGKLQDGIQQFFSGTSNSDTAC